MHQLPFLVVCDASGWLCLVVENLVLLFNDILGILDFINNLMGESKQAATPKLE
jgi:hypothetical protein